MNILARERIGLVLRVFAKTPDQVDKNAGEVLKAARQAATLRIGNRNIFSKILIAVASDTRRIDHDCGMTAQWIRDALTQRPEPRIRIFEAYHSDLFCGILNDSMLELFEDRCRYATVLSHTALGYLTAENMLQTIEAFERGAKVCGVAIEELQESVLEGRVANTFATWDIKALLGVGGFDLKAAQPFKDDRLANYLRGWSTTAGEVYYPYAGVEEIISLCRLVERHGKCIAPITPHDTAEWKEPDPQSDPEGYKRHLKKMGTKHERQMAFTTSIGFDLSYLRGGVMQ